MIGIKNLKDEIMVLFQFFSRYMRGLFFVLLAILRKLQFLSVCLVDARVIIGLSTFLALHSYNNSSSFFLCHGNKVIINKAILNDG